MYSYTKFKGKRDVFVTLILKHPYQLIHSCRTEGAYCNSTIMETEAPEKKALQILEQKLAVCDKSYKERRRKCYFWELSQWPFTFQLIGQVKKSQRALSRDWQFPTEVA